MSCFLNINHACSEIIYAVGKGILEDKILKKLSPSQLSVTVRVQVLVGSSFDPNSGFSHLSPHRFCQGYFSDGSGSRVSLLCLLIMVNSVCVSKMMCHQMPPCHLYITISALNLTLLKMKRIVSNILSLLGEFCAVWSNKK